MGRQGNTGISIGTNGNKVFSIQNSEYSSKEMSLERKINKNIAENKYEYKISVKPDGQGKKTQEKLLKSVKNPDLANAIKQLYRRTAQIGKGGTADVLRYEAKYKVKLSKTGHLTKANDYLNNLRSIKKYGTLTRSERNVIEREIKKLEKAIKYYNKRRK